MLHILKSPTNLLLVSNCLSNKLKVQFLANKRIMRDVNGNVVAITQRKRKFVLDDLHGGMQSGCGQFTCMRRSGGALVPPTQTCGCEEHLYATKHGEGHESM